MLIDIASDIHLSLVSDLGDPFFTANAPFLALLGDVCEVRQIRKMLPVFKRMSERWEKVFYVLGNHEYYQGCLDTTVDYIREEMKPFRNIHVLSNDAISIDEVTFIGTTLWSDMDRNNPMTKEACKVGISDYYFIFPTLKDLSFRSRAIRPDDTVRLFNINTSYIDQMLRLFNETKTIVILTHHAPSYQSIMPRFKTSPLTGAFASNLEHIMVDNDQIKLWAHGHCHSDFDYNVEQCRVVCHPKGYLGELYRHPHEYIPMTVEI
jgi:hypothetical protein